jgi:hypothetical protein
MRTTRPVDENIVGLFPELRSDGEHALDELRELCQRPGVSPASQCRPVRRLIERILDAGFANELARLEQEVNRERKRD